MQSNQKTAILKIGSSTETVINGTYMAKTNFSKVEELLQSSLSKIKVERWGKLADIAQSIERPEMRKFAEQATLSAAKSELDKKALIHGLKRTLKETSDPAFFETLGTTASELENLVKEPKLLSQDQWSRLQEIRAKIKEAQSAASPAPSPENSDQTIVQSEREKHLNKRFNVKDNWLPLK